MKHALHLLALIVLISSPAGAQDEKKYSTTWTKAAYAKKNSEKSRYGILYYFPPKASGEMHPFFELEEVTIESRKFPMVKIHGEKTIKVREEYKPDDRFHVIILTDWFGNPLHPKPFVARNAKGKFDLKKMVKLIRNTENFVEANEMALAKKLKKANKAFDKENWKSAIREYSSITGFRGYEACTAAREKLDEINSLGRFELDRIKKLPPDEQEKALKKVQKDFKGSPVADEAKKALAGLGNG